MKDEGYTYHDFLYEPDGTITTLAVPGTVPDCKYAGNELLGTYNVVPRTISLHREGVRSLAGQEGQRYEDRHRSLVD